MKNKSLKLWMSVWIAVVLALILLPAGCVPAEEEEELTIGIFQIVWHPALDAAREGFKRALYDEEILNVRYIERNAAGSMDMCYTIADYFVSVPVDMIVAISTPCVIAAATAVEGTTIPVVFNSVTNPVAAGVVDDWEVPGGQVTGVSDLAPVVPQIQMILDVFEANNLTFADVKLGVVYNPAEINSWYQVDVQLPEALADLGLTGNVTVVKSPAADLPGVGPAAMALTTAPLGPVDAIWVPACNTAVGAFEAIIAAAHDPSVKIPVFAADVATVERGAIGAWGPDYFIIGYNSGLMAVDILVHGANPATMPVQIAPADLLYLNLKSAADVDLVIPQSLIDIAHKVIGP